MREIFAQRTIKAPLKKVRAFVWDIQSWAQFWAPLHKVCMRYDDGIHQDFEMALDWQRQETVVRTVRFLEHEGEISFFSPIPPSPTTIHHGSWKFFEHADKTTRLVAFRSFFVPDFVDVDQFSSEFTQRLNSLLEKMGNQCEK